MCILANKDIAMVVKLYCCHRLRVTCDGMHLHYISVFQFIDSPEWEAGHVTSDDYFQVNNTSIRVIFIAEHRFTLTSGCSQTLITLKVILDTYHRNKSEENKSTVKLNH